MATASWRLIDALQRTRDRLVDSGVRYQWTHQGACNCGHLAQTLTSLSPEELHRIALEKVGDWTEHVIDYCPTSGYPIDHVISTMLELGLTREDIRHLERLSCPRVRQRMREQRARLASAGAGVEHDRREDVVAYLDAWVALLREQLPPSERAPSERAPIEAAGGASPALDAVGGAHDLAEAA